MSKLTLMGIAIVMLASASAPAAWYVVPGGAGAQTGTNWADAFGTIQAGINAAGSGQEVWVKVGTYAEASQPTNMLTMKTGVAVYGGFAGTESARTQRDWVANRTILDPGRTLVRGALFSGVNSARLDGFTVANIDARYTGGALIYGGGAAFYGSAKSNTIANCVLLKVFAFSGGGAYVEGGSDDNTFTNCMFLNCGSHNGLPTPYQFQPAGGIYASARIYVYDCDFYRCDGNYAAAAYFNGGTGSVFDRCRLAAMSTSSGYAAMLNSSSATFRNCLFSGNPASSTYYGVLAFGQYGGSYGDVINCTFADNGIADTVRGAAIAVKLASGTPVRIRNCVFRDHQGWALYEEDGQAGIGEVSNCVFYANTPGDYRDRNGATNTGATAINALAYAKGNLDSDPQFAGGPRYRTWTANATWNATTMQTTLTDANANYTPGELAGRFVNVDQYTTKGYMGLIATNTATQIMIWGDYTGIPHSGDTYFVRDYAPIKTSPCVNAGTSNGAPGTDIRGRTRPLASGYDIGAYEDNPVTTQFVDKAASGPTYNGASWATAFTNIQDGINAAEPGDYVLVASGTYNEPAKTNQLVDMKSGVRVLGGFDKAEASIAERDWEANPTILCPGRTYVRDVRLSGVQYARLDGFNVVSARCMRVTTNAFAGAPGGIGFDSGADLNLIANCRILGNQGLYGGGIGVNVAYDNVISNCVIANNVTHNGEDGLYYLGGGLYCSGGRTYVSDSVFAFNSATYGGHFGASASVDTFDRCVFAGGGGVYATIFTDSGADTTLRNCLLAGNTSYAGYVGGAFGGGFYGNITLRAINCTFGRNRAATGAVAINRSAGSILRNCLFADNTSYAVAETVNNSAGVTGVIQELSYSFFDSVTTNAPGDVLFDSTTPATGATAINGHAEANHNLDGDGGFTTRSGAWNANSTYDAARGRTTMYVPAATFTPGALAGLVVRPWNAYDTMAYIVTNTASQLEVWGDCTANALNGRGYVIYDYRPSPKSRCINAATTNGIPSVDLTGARRPQNGGYDIGCYEVWAPRGSVVTIR